MKKINLNSVAFLVGVFLLVTPALSQAIITSLVTAFYRNIDLLVWVNLAQNFWILNLLPKVVGAALVAGFAWKHLKTRFKCDLPKIKVQTTRLATYSLLFMLCASLFLFADVPISEAATTATTGYILDTPISEYDWLVGQYSNGNYYAINGSNWDNLVGGVGSTAWSAYTGNSTALVEQVLAACTSGHILLKDVEFDYGLTIPENVTVTERNNGLDRTFINAANSQGSPYTVSVEGVNYFAQDRENRICQTSTNIATVFQNILASDTSISFGSGLFTFDWVANLTSGSVYPYSVIANGLSRISITGTGQTNFKVNDNQAISLLLLNNCNNITIKGINWDGNKANNPVTGASHLYGNTIMTLGTTTALTVEGCYFANVIGHPIIIDDSGGNHLITQNSFYSNDWYDVAFAVATKNCTASYNYFTNSRGMETYANANDISFLFNTFIHCGVNDGNSTIASQHAFIKVIGNTFLDNQNPVILINGVGCIVQNNIINNSYLAGVGESVINVGASAVATQVFANQILNTDGAGSIAAILDYGGSSIIANTISNCNGSGILVGGNNAKIESNTITNTVQTSLGIGNNAAIQLQDDTTGHKVAFNTITNNGVGNGICNIGNNNLIQGNTVTGFAQYGVFDYIGNYNQYVSNRIYNNGAEGKDLGVIDATGSYCIIQFNDFSDSTSGWGRLVVTEGRTGDIIGNNINP